MFSDIRVKDPAKRPIVTKRSASPICDYTEVKFPSRFSRKKMFKGYTVSIYNNNFTKMPKDF